MTETLEMEKKIADKVRDIGLDGFIEIHRPRFGYEYRMYNRIPMDGNELRKLKFEYRVFLMIQSYATAPCDGVRTPEMVAENLCKLLKKRPIVKKYLKIY